MKYLNILTLSLFAFVSCTEPGPVIKAEANNLPSEHNILHSELDTFYFGDQLVHIEKINAADFHKVLSSKEIKAKREAYYLEKDSGFVRRHVDTLIFITETKILSLINKKTDDDTHIDYSYQGYLKEIDQFLVYGQFYEWFNYFLVDRVTGDTTMTVVLLYYHRIEQNLFPGIRIWKQALILMD